MLANQNAKLDVDRLWLSFGGVYALNEVSLKVKDNEILAIIGPNGAAKRRNLL